MKIRLDQYLVQHGLIQSRERAKAMIMAGVVYVNGQIVESTEQNGRVFVTVPFGDTFVKIG